MLLVYRFTWKLRGFDRLQQRKMRELNKVLAKALHNF